MSCRVLKALVERHRVERGLPRTPAKTFADFVTSDHVPLDGAIDPEKTAVVMRQWAELERHRHGCRACMRDRLRERRRLTMAWGRRLRAHQRAGLSASRAARPRRFR